MNDNNIDDYMQGVFDFIVSSMAANYEHQRNFSKRDDLLYTYHHNIIKMLENLYLENRSNFDIDFAKTRIKHFLDHPPKIIDIDIDPSSDLGQLAKKKQADMMRNNHLQHLL